MTIRTARISVYERGKYLRDRDLLKLLKKNGWKIVRVHGSHYILQKDEKTTVVPVHGRDVPKGLLNKILKDTGLY